MLEFLSMRRAHLIVVLALLSTSASAQPEVFFGSGTAPVFKEQEPDRRFEKSRIHRGLRQGTQDANCAHVLSGLLTLMAEAAPYLHKRDENFYLDPVLVQALSTQLVNGRFPGNAYFVSMVRRVMIDGKMPAEWISTAQGLNAKGATIDVAKLQYLAQGVRPIESFYFTYPALRQRYEVEVLRANSAARSTAMMSFRDAYMDRDVAWTGFVLLDLGPPKKPKKKKGKPAAEPEFDGLVATLQWLEPDPNANSLNIYGKPVKKKPVILEARLATEQFVDIHRIPKGTRLLVRGRLWELNDDLSRIELRNAVLFGERDWSNGALLADPNAVAMCPLAVNDLAGTAPVQPGGFGQRLGQ